jgi:hypothetical protein
VESQRLPAVLTEDDWQALLSREVGREVRVRYTRARQQVVRLLRSRSGVEVRLARFFEHAPAEVRVALATWMRSGRRAKAATRALDSWIELRVRELADASPRRVALEPRGRRHDLAKLAGDVRARELAGDALDPRLGIGWGRARGSRSRRSLRLGSFDSITRSVRIHPVLDSDAVPDWFVRYVVFHELLHAVLDEPSNGRSRRVIHGPEFRRRERAYADLDRALRWEKEHIDSLIRCARAEKPLALPRKPRERAEAPRNWLQRLLF